MAESLAAVVLAFFPNLGIELYAYGVLAVSTILFIVAIVAVTRYMKSL